MITVVTDVAYDDATGVARAAAVVLPDPTAADPTATYTATTPIADGYRAGELYARELPALAPLLVPVVREHHAGLVVVDAHVDFAIGPGLGRRVLAALAAAGLRVAVLGIAKNPHPAAVAAAVHRGGSDRPLWVSATDRPPPEAAALVAAMAGAHRLPDAVRLADRLARRFQAVLHEGTGFIDVCDVDTINAGNSADNGAQATAGIQKDSANALEYSCDTPDLTDGTQLLYVPLSRDPIGGRPAARVDPVGSATPSTPDPSSETKSLRRTTDCRTHTFRYVEGVGGRGCGWVAARR